jgi:pimeloyl-ACP methyl ester carboxylesterase
VADPCDRTKNPWPYTRTRPWSRYYLGWDQRTPREAIIVLPTEWDQNNPPQQPPPLVISPHGRNNGGYANACAFWKDAPADGQFVLVSPEGLGRAHDSASDPYAPLPTNLLGFFTYGYPGQIDDLARMPTILQEVLPWLTINPEKIYVLGSSMGGLETLLLAARHPDGVLAGGTGQLQGAAAYDSPCDLETQCAYLTHTAPDTAARMIEEIGSEPLNRQGWDDGAMFYDPKQKGGHPTIRDLLKTLPNDQALWDERSPMTLTTALSSLQFPLKIYWSNKDIVVGNQATAQSGKLAAELQGATNVASYSGDWRHSDEFVYGSAGERLSEALQSFGLLS